jgi:hypothetical protein
MNYFIYRIESNLEKFTGKNDNQFYPIYLTYAKEKIEIPKEFNTSNFKLIKMISLQNEDEHYVMFLKDAFIKKYKQIFKMIE